MNLRAAGADEIFAEQISSVAPREQLEAALKYVRKGDVFMVTKLDRLARSVSHLTKIVETLETKGVTLRILGMGLDTSTPNGRLMVNVFGSVAQFEREMMLERQKEGIAAARKEGRYAGRKPTAMAKSAEIIALVKAGMTKEAVATKLGIGVASVYRALRIAA